VAVRLLDPARRGLTVRRLRVNRKPLRNCASLAQPSRARNRVYSHPGHLSALATLAYFRRILRPKRTVLLCLTAATAFWLSPHTLSNTWRRFFDGWRFIRGSICMWRIAVFAVPRPGMILSLEPRFSGMFHCLRATHGLTCPTEAPGKNRSSGCAIREYRSSFARVGMMPCCVLWVTFVLRFGSLAELRSLPTPHFFLARTQTRWLRATAAGGRAASKRFCGRGFSVLPIR